MHRESEVLFPDNVVGLRDCNVLDTQHLLTVFHLPARTLMWQWNNSSVSSWWDFRYVAAPVYSISLDFSVILQLLYPPAWCDVTASAKNRSRYSVFSSCSKYHLLVGKTLHLQTICISQPVLSPSCGSHSYPVVFYLGKRWQEVNKLAVIDLPEGLFRVLRNCCSHPWSVNTDII